MLTKLLERNIASADQRLVLLAPPDTSLPAGFRNVDYDPVRHSSLVAELQRLRGSIYLDDGALRRDQLTADGRHDTPEDRRAWHLLIRDAQSRITGCIWYLKHPHLPNFDDLRLRHSPLARDHEWGGKLRGAIRTDVARAVREQVHYAEVGGWAVSRSGHLTDCLLLVLGTYGVSQMLGGAFVVATATVRHASAAVLRRLGGSRLQGDTFAVPTYYDSNYDCEMEILRFDTRRPNPRFSGMVESLKAQFASIPVVASHRVTEHAPLGLPALAPFAVGGNAQRAHAAA